MKMQELIWDETEIAQSRAKELLEEGHAITSDEAFETACADADLFEREFELFREEFSRILREISPSGHFYVKGWNMGWRRRSGDACIRAENSMEFIRKAFPHTSEWDFYGEFHPEKRMMKYKLCHHDAPTGERYELYSAEPESFPQCE